MADEPTTPPTDDDDVVVDATEAAASESEAPEPAAAPGAEPTAETTKLPTVDAPAPTVPVAAASPRWNPDRRSVVVTLVAVAALAASFGLGWAAGAANDDDGDVRRIGHMQRFERGAMPGAPGMQGGRSDAPGHDRRERPGSFDQGFDGPRGRSDDASSAGDERMSARGGVVGTITKIDGDTLTIDAIGPERGGSTKVELDDDVDVIVRGGGDRESGSRDDLEEGVIIAAHGDSDVDEDDDTLDADRVVVLRAAE